jgi:putative CocE/NonD family hydrolase
MSRLRVGVLALALLALPLAGCVGGEDLEEASADAEDPTANDTEYTPPERQPDLEVEEFSELVPMPDEDVNIHVRVVKPADADEAPVVAEFTPYNAPGEPMLVEPPVDEPLSSYYVEELVKRGFAFAFADVRGTSDSGGCLDLRGSVDVQDADRLTEWLGTQDWSTGNVGFIGASYPGSEAHIAAIADNEHLGGVVPIVASTSFYDYHHKDGVPYGGHASTNAVYNVFAGAPSANPQYDNWLTKEAYQATECDQVDQILRGFDDSGTYDAWWVDRDLNHRIDEIDVPVLMAQGLADWNVKPDHIDPWFNELDTDKTLVAPQMGHAIPPDADEAYGDWWPFAAAFFDATLNGADTGLFDEDRAYVEADDGTWRTYEDAWPPTNASTMTVNLTEDGLAFDEAPSGEVAWYAPEAEEQAFGQPAGEYVREDTEVVLESEPLPRDVHLSGTPTLNLTVQAEETPVHLTAVLEVSDGTTENALGEETTSWERENYGYLNPVFRNGLDDPQRVLTDEPTPVTIEMYPQEDVVETGERLRLTLASDDDGRTQESYEPGEVTALLDGERPAQLELPLSPLAG